MLFSMLDQEEQVPLIISCVLTSVNFLSLCPGSFYHPIFKEKKKKEKLKYQSLLQAMLCFESKSHKVLTKKLYKAL